jgi:UDP-4-amino-4,6-dideoxy-N-acetyl-beta-L-altrosamine transaminase
VDERRASAQLDRSEPSSHRGILTKSPALPPKTAQTAPIPYGRHQISDADIAAVVDVLRSDWLTQGPAVPRFEAAVAAYCGVAHAVAANSATSALHLACMALGVGPRDRVWTSPISFVASANCALYCGAEVEFVDIDPATSCLSVTALASKLAEAEREGRLPKVVVPVHFAGQACDMAAIHALGQRYGFTIIEDAAQALGGRYRDEPVGSCRYSDITVFSFHPVKSITTAEGGIAVTNDPAAAAHMRRLRTHGITTNADEMSHAPDGPWYSEQVELGFNYRLTDVQAALGLSQLEALDAYVSRRRAIAARYDELLRDLPVAAPRQHPDGVSAWHLYVVRLKLSEVRRTHREVFELLREAGIGVQLHHIPIYRHPFHAQRGHAPAAYPEAERYYAEAISLPIFPGLTDEQQDDVVAALRRACAA